MSEWPTIHSHCLGAAEEADVSCIAQQLPHYPYLGPFKALEVSVGFIRQQNRDAARRYLELGSCQETRLWRRLTRDNMTAYIPLKYSYSNGVLDNSNRWAEYPKQYNRRVRAQEVHIMGLGTLNVRIHDKVDAGKISDGKVVRDRHLLERCPGRMVRQDLRVDGSQLRPFRNRAPSRLLRRFCLTICVCAACSIPLQLDHNKQPFQPGDGGVRPDSLRAPSTIPPTTRAYARLARRRGLWLRSSGYHGTRPSGWPGLSTPCSSTYPRPPGCGARAVA